jgi:GNAT superfamily N-acetyltransferase
VRSSLAVGLPERRRRARIYRRPARPDELVDLHGQVVEEDGVPIGHLVVVDRADHLYLDQLVLVPDARGRGIGSELVRGVMDTADMLGLPVRLTVADRSRPRELFERLGLWVTNVDNGCASMEWSRAPDRPVTTIEDPDARPMEQLRAALNGLDAGDAAERALSDALYWLLLDAIGGSKDGFTPDGATSMDVVFRSPNTVTATGQMYALGTVRHPIDPFSATIELAPGNGAIAAFILKWGDAATGLGATEDYDHPRDPARVADWLYVFRWTM